MKRRAFTVIEALVIIAIIVILAMILIPMFTPARESGGYNPDSRCGSNLKHAMLGLLQYCQDSDEKFPPIASSGATFGWADSLIGYTQTSVILQCGRESNKAGNRNPRQSGYTDYWFNRNIAKRQRTKITNSISLIVLGDGNDGKEITDARYSLSALPQKWIDNHNSPLHRHRKHQ